MLELAIGFTLGALWARYFLPPRYRVITLGERKYGKDKIYSLRDTVREMREALDGRHISLALELIDIEYLLGRIAIDTPRTKPRKKSENVI